MMEAIGVFTLVVCSLVAGTLWKAYVLTILWAWFAMPHFGVAALTIPVAIGIILCVSLLSVSSQSGDDKREMSEKIASAMGHVFCFPALVLLIGWIAKQWM